jgi:hypothetical protein
MAEKRWIDWPHDECPECGDDIQILTDCPQTPQGVDAASLDGEPPYDPPYCWSGDTWRCLGDGHVGTVYTDGETPVQIEWGGQTTADVDLPA